MHYTPTSSSWMNLVERFFHDLTEFITEKSFASTRDLADAIIAFLAARNENPRRYVWKAKGEEILRKINAAREALAAAALKSLYFRHSTPEAANPRCPSAHARNIGNPAGESRLNDRKQPFFPQIKAMRHQPAVA